VRCLICRVEGRTCALRLEDVVEIMRPLSIERFEPAPSFVLGVSIIRGTPRVVVDAGALIAGRGIPLGPAGTRFVVLRAGAQQAALAVSEVEGIATLPAGQLNPLPGLLAAQTSIVDQLGQLDGELLEVLRSGLIVDQAELLVSGAAP
jgi:chemotaxis signal transduction protein